MAINKLIFKDAEKVRDSITESQKKEIAKLYEGWADEIGKMADYYSHKTTASAPLSERYYKELKKQLTETSHQVSNELYKGIKNNMYIVSDSVVADNVNWLKSFGFSEEGLNAAFSFVPDSVVRSIVTGQVYESGWSLSERIWGNNEETMQDLYRIVAGGVAQQTPIYQISKQLEQYVRPSAAKQWNLKDKDGKMIYPRQVDYNAQRLARTLVQHSYQQSFDAVCHNNPFVIDYVWRANGSRVCELCMERDGKHYPKDALPLDHPNGMCTMEPNVDDNMDDKLVEWFNSEDGTFPEIDEFAKEFGYDASKYGIDSSSATSIPSVLNTLSNNEVNGTDISMTWQRREDEYKFEIDDIINAQGFDGLPKVVSSDEFDKYVEESGLYAQRVYSSNNAEVLDEYRKQLYNGKFYVDCSTGGADFGQGMYMSGDFTGKQKQDVMADSEMYVKISEQRGNKYSNIEKMTLSKDAKIITYDNLLQEYYKEVNAAQTEITNNVGHSLVEKYVSENNLNADDRNFLLWGLNISKDIEPFDVMKAMKYDGDKTTINSIREKISNEIQNLKKSNAIISTNGDMGMYGALKGYDAVNIEKEATNGASQVLVLNRTKLIIKGE